VTDSERGVSYDPATRPGVANLLTILDTCESLSTGTGANGIEAGRDEGTTTRLETLASRFAALSHADLKRLVTEGVEATVAPIRDAYARIRADESYLRDVAETGRMRAAQAAEETMMTVREVLGVGRL
jgi:tryptophanyl-tRNA synthetase